MQLLLWPSLPFTETYFTFYSLKVSKPILFCILTAVRHKGNLKKQPVAICRPQASASPLVTRRNASLINLPRNEIPQHACTESFFKLACITVGCIGRKSTRSRKVLGSSVLSASEALVSLFMHRRQCPPTSKQFVDVDVDVNAIRRTRRRSSPIGCTGLFRSWVS